MASTFGASALSLAALNLRVTPVLPRDKAAFLDGWEDLATTDPTVIMAWDEKYPNYNVGVVAKLIIGELCLLEFDQGTLEEIAAQCGKPVPKTRTVTSGSGGRHWYFLHTEESVALGNCQARLNGHEWFSFRADDRHCVAPGSIHPNGNLYKFDNDNPIIPIPTWLVEWLKKNAERKVAPKGSVEVHPDFDFDEWSEHYGFEYEFVKDDVWHVVSECPGVGRRHEQSIFTGVYYDGSTLGWNCFAGGCELCGKSIGGVMKWMHDHGKGPYQGIIWSDKEDMSWLNDPKFDIELVDDMPQESTDRKAVAVTPPVPVQVPAAPVEDGMDAAWAELAEKANPTPLPVPDDIDAIVNATPAEGLAFDERALYGKAGEIARQIGLPLGWTYPGVLGVASALDIRDRDNHVRSNMYVALIAAPGMAKTAVQEAIEKSIFIPVMTLTYTTPASDRGLAKQIGSDGNTILLMEDELRAVLGKCAVPNSTLAQMLNKLWNKDKAGVADKKGKDECIGKLCIVGNLACADPVEFSQAFGSSTVSGLYSRFIYAYDTTPVKYRPRTIKTEFFTDEMVVRIPAWCWDAKDRWEGDEGKRIRMGEHALRIALVTAALNGDKEITPACMAAAFRFMEWQERLRKKFKPGLAETKEAEALEAVYAALREQRDYQVKTNTVHKDANDYGHEKDVLPKFVHFTDTVKKKNLYRKYGSLVTRAKAVMAEDGIIKQVKEIVHEYEENGKYKGEKVGDPTPFYVVVKDM